MPVLDRRNEVARNRAALGAVLELETAALGQRLDLQFDHAELAVTAGLAHETALGFRRAPDRFAIRHLRLADIGVDLELAQHPVNDNLQMQLAHPGDQRLRGLLVDADAERRIFFGQLLQRLAELLLIGLGLGLDRDLDNRIGKLDRFEHNRMGRVAQSVTRGRIAQAHRANIAGEDLGDLLALVRVHLDQPPDSLALAPGRIQHRTTAL